MNHTLYEPEDPRINQIINCIGYVEITQNDTLEGWFGIRTNCSSNLTNSLSEEPVLYSNSKGHSLLYTARNTIALKEPNH